MMSSGGASQPFTTSDNPALLASFPLTCPTGLPVVWFVAPLQESFGDIPLSIATTIKTSDRMGPGGLA
jgi:hypothetical protein